MSKKTHRVAELADLKIEALEKEKSADDKDRYLRLAADFDNFKKRTARQFSDIIESADEGLVLELLDIIDDFERALNSFENERSSDNGGEHLYTGTKLIYEKLLNLLKNRGIEKMDVLGKMFDPVLHEAVMQSPSDKDEGSVIDVVSPGYIRKGKVIRHARVVVASPQQDP